jgi:hypothetical protein
VALRNFDSYLKIVEIVMRVSQNVRAAIELLEMAVWLGYPEAETVSYSDLAKLRSNGNKSALLVSPNSDPPLLLALQLFSLLQYDCESLPLNFDDFARRSEQDRYTLLLDTQHNSPAHFGALVGSKLKHIIYRHFDTKYYA